MLNNGANGELPPENIGKVSRQKIKELAIVASTLDRVRSCSAWSPWLMPKIAETTWTSLCEEAGVKILDLREDGGNQELLDATIGQLFGKRELAGHLIQANGQEYVLVSIDTVGSHHKPEQPPLIEARKMEDFNYLSVVERADFERVLGLIVGSPVTSGHYLMDKCC